MRCPSFSPARSAADPARTPRTSFAAREAPRSKPRSKRPIFSVWTSKQVPSAVASIAIVAPSMTMERILAANSALVHAAMRRWSDSLPSFSPRLPASTTSRMKSSSERAPFEVFRIS